MKKLLVWLLCLGLVGCAALDNIRTRNRENLIKFSIGMTKQEVLNIMGTKTILSSTNLSKINNPYRSEILQGKGKTSGVLYYLTDIKKMMTLLPMTN